MVIGNPPWINYNKTVSDLRTGLEQLSKDTYGIWQGGRYATHQDVAGLFYTRSVDLYLKDGGVIGMVMPHSALQTGQYAKMANGPVWQPMRGGAAGRRRSGCRFHVQARVGFGATSSQTRSFRCPRAWSLRVGWGATRTRPARRWPVALSDGSARRARMT